MTLSQKVVLAIIKALLRIFFSWKVNGKENVPPTGPLIVTANHVHVLDPFFLLFILPRWINFMAKEELFRSPILKLILQWAHTVPVSRRGTTKDKREAVRQAKDILDRGLVLGMFPEGERSREGKLIRGKPGPAVMASQAGVPLLPIGIAGTDKIKGIGWLWRRHHIVINIGQPFKLPPLDGKLNKSQMRLLTHSLMNEIAALLPPEQRGTYKEYGN
jgi:1-acyl-sn-glycerol-3-phosphate acyltransferase